MQVNSQTYNLIDRIKDASIMAGHELVHSKPYGCQNGRHYWYF